jgi:hypothetical protein
MPPLRGQPDAGVVRSEAKRLRIGLDWPSRGAAVGWEGEAWLIKSSQLKPRLYKNKMLVLV